MHGARAARVRGFPEISVNLPGTRVPVQSAWFLERFFGVLGQCVIRKSARRVLGPLFYARDTENGRW